MNFRKFHAAAVVLIASAGLLNQARATDIYVGSPYGPTIVISNTGQPDLDSPGSGGGDFTNSTINGDPNNNGAGGTPLPWVYCVDVVNHVSPGTNFPNAQVTHDGKVNGDYVGGGTDSTIADKIAFVLLNYGTNGTTQGAVQAAIWFLEYGKSNSVITTITDGVNGGGSNSPALITLAQGYVNAANSHDTTGMASRLSWLTLTTDNKTQGLVTLVTPEPASFAIAALAGLGMLSHARRRRSR